MGNAPPGFADVTSTGLQLMRDAARAAELRRIGNLDLARQVLEEIVPIFRGYRLTLEDLTARDLAEVSNLRARANDAGQLTLWVLVASGGFGLVFAFAVALFITRSIAGPLGALENAALAVSYGDLNARSNVTQPRELAHLSQLINAMVAAVQERTQELEDRNRQLLDARALASTDGLTGVLNHRAFQERIRALVAAASKTAPVSLIMLDLDGFKQINDRLGHQKGDEILRLCTEACVRIVGSDAVYRYGGDEIAVVAEAADLDEAGRIAEKHSQRDCRRRHRSGKCDREPRRGVLSTHCVIRRRADIPGGCGNVYRQVNGKEPGLPLGRDRGCSAARAGLPAPRTAVTHARRTRRCVWRLGRKRSLGDPPRPA